MSAALQIVPRSVDEEAAAEINAEHARFQAKLGEALAHAKRAGELLLGVKANLAHGQFGPWIEAHCTFSRRTAGLYTFLAKKWQTIGPEKRQRVADMTLRQALIELTAPGASEENTPRPDPALAEQARTICQHLRELARIEPRLLAQHLSCGQRDEIADMAPRTALLLTELATLVTPYLRALVHFETLEDMENFSQRIGMPVTMATKRITFG